MIRNRSLRNTITLHDLFRYKGSTYTAAAMKEVYEKVISKSNGWRMGSGPATCSGVIIDGTCYWIPKSYVSASQIDETCQAGMNGGQPAVSITSLLHHRYVSGR